ncbi:MAG: class I SAM-dependent methyltransferase [Bacteroidota bacterium]
MKPFLSTKDFMLSQEVFELYYHQELDMLETKPKPTDLGKYYSSEAYISHSDGKHSFFEKVYQYAKQFTIRKKVRLLRKYRGIQSKLLDLGAGTGDFLSHAKAKNWHINGVEPNSRARALAFKKGVVLNKEWDSLQGNSFDVITLWHVLEHLPDLKERIEAIVELLDPNGTLIVAVPNFKSFDAKYYKAFWAGYDVPRHLWHFSKDAISQLFETHGMDTIKIKPMWLDAFYVALLSERYKKRNFPWLRALSIGAWSNLLGLFTKEYSSHCYVLQKAQR